jgi:uncharacterized membrane protein YfcA
MAGWLCLGAAPAAFVGAWVVASASAPLIELVIRTLTAATGVNSLRAPNITDSCERVVATPLLLAIGAATGFVSSRSGTGGPLVLVPILMLMKLPMLTVIGLSQIIQLPIAVVGTLGLYFYGDLDWLLGLILAAALLIGAWQGAYLAHVVRPDVLPCRVGCPDRNGRAHACRGRQTAARQL